MTLLLTILLTNGLVSVSAEIPACHYARLERTFSLTETNWLGVDSAEYEFKPRVVTLSEPETCDAAFYRIHLIYVPWCEAIWDEEQRAEPGRASEQRKQSGAEPALGSSKRLGIMTSRDFCYWLQGHFEISETKTLGERETEMVKRHLALVFKHEIDPSIPDPTGELGKIHHGKPGEVLVRC